MKKPFLIALALVAVTVAACGGKVVVESSGASGTGGTGGTSTTVSTADGMSGPVTTGVTVGQASVAVASVTTGTGMGCDPGNTCAAAITPPDGNPDTLCDNTLSAKLYFALVECTCVDICQVECAGSACVGAPPSPTCSACLQDPVMGCGNQFQSCANDV